MHILIVITHVAAMCLSIGLMTGAIGLGLSGKKVAARVAKYGLGASIFGFVSGIILLLDAPLSLQCATLTSYLLATTLLYRFGFALGDASKARLIRQPAN